MVFREPGLLERILEDFDRCGMHDEAERLRHAVEVGEPKLLTV